MADLPIKKLKELYYKKDYSACEVGKELGVSQGVIYKFMRKHGIPRRDVFEQSRVSFKRKPLSFKLKKNLTLRQQKLKVAGIMLYWAEGAVGDKSHTIDFANSDPRMVKLFVKFLREICGIDEQRLRAYLYCYVNQDIERLKKYWSRLINVPLLQFSKPYVRKDYMPKSKRIMKYGLVHIRYNDKKLLEVILDWIDQYVSKNI